jgi:WD40 repeat protein
MSPEYSRLWIVAGLALGLSQVVRGAAPQAEVPHAPKEEKPARTDRYGDPLPPGAIARLGTIRLRHAEDIGEVAFSPDGKLLVSADGLGTAFGPGVTRPENLCLWEASTGKRLRRFGTGGSLSRVAFSPDGKLIASTLVNEISLWDVVTGNELRAFSILGGRSNVVTDVAFSPDGKLLASAGYDQRVRLWDPSTGKELSRLGEQASSVCSIAFMAPMGKVLATANSHGTVHLWEAATGRELRHFVVPQESSLRLSPDGRMLIVRGRNTPISLWDVATAKKLYSLADSKTCNFPIAVSADGKAVAAADDEGKIRIWDAATGTKRQVFQTTTIADQPSTIEVRAFSPDGKTLVTADQGQLRLWDVATGRERLPFPGHPGTIDQLVYARDGKTLSSRGPDGTVIRWDVATAQPLSRAEIAGPVDGSFVFSPDGRILVPASGPAPVSLWGVATGKELSRLHGHDKVINAAAFSPDGKALASAGDDGTACLWDVATAKELRTIRVPTQGYRMACVAFTPDGKALVTGSSDRTIRLWDCATGKLLREVATKQQFGEYEDRHRMVFSFLVAPDGHTLLAHADGRVYRWDLATGRELPPFVPEGSAGWAFALSADGRMAATVRFDRKAQLANKVDVWELPSGKRIRQFEAPYELRAVAFAPDGRTVASAGGGDCAILIWDVTGLLEDGRLPAVPLAARELAQLWDDLAAADAAVAARAVWRMTAGGPQVGSFLRRRLLPVAPADGRLTKLIEDLDADRYAVREDASRELRRLAERAEPLLRQKLRERPPLEFRRRAEEVLRELDWPVTSPERLQAGRALQVLEQIGTAEARQVLEALAKGWPEARLTQDAKAALRRLAGRGTGSP